MDRLSLPISLKRTLLTYIMVSSQIHYFLCNIKKGVCHDLAVN